jgi:energy-coupling factor transport system permease protein
MMNSFSTYHPGVNFFYFTAMITGAMFFTHPVFQGISLFSAFVYYISLKWKKGLKVNVCILILMLLLTAFINPLFNHEGVTIIFYLKSGNPVTFESILCGISSGVMFATVILWFGCYNAVMTSDKFTYLFGKIIPASSLIFSMALRFVPRYMEQIKIISDGQKCIGKDVTQGCMIQRVKNGLKILSIMTIWALENSVETADSMKSRGYGLPNRSSFYFFRFDGRDRFCLFTMVVLMALVLVGALTGHNTIRFFPSIKYPPITFFSLSLYAVYFFLCITPVAINLLEAFLWEYIKSGT